MKLIDYLRENGFSDEQFAAKVGRSKWAVRKWMYGQRTPRAGEMQLIAIATNGSVTANDFMTSRPFPEDDIAGTAPTSEAAA